MAPTDIFDATAKAQMRDRLGSAIRRLPDRQREALVLRVYHDHAFAEIGAIMCCSEGTAKANYHHAVNRLRQVLIGGRGHRDLQRYSEHDRAIFRTGQWTLNVSVRSLRIWKSV